MHARESMGCFVHTAHDNIFMMDGILPLSEIS